MRKKGEKTSRYSGKHRSLSEVIVLVLGILAIWLINAAVLMLAGDRLYVGESRLIRFLFEDLRLFLFLGLSCVFTFYYVLGFFLIPKWRTVRKVKFFTITEPIKVHSLLVFIIVTLLVYLMVVAALLLYFPSIVLWGRPWFLVSYAGLFPVAFLVLFYVPFYWLSYGLAEIFEHEGIGQVVKRFLVAYMGAVILFGVGYSIIYRLVLNSFEPCRGLSLLDFIYFSIVTITTLGYGDIEPVHWTSKLLSSTEVLFGIVLVVIYFGTTISLILRENPRNRRNKT